MSQRQSRHISLDQEINHPDLTWRVYNMQCLVAPYMCLLRHQRNRLQVTTSWVCSQSAMRVPLMSRAPDPILVKILLSNVAVIGIGA